MTWEQVADQNCLAHGARCVLSLQTGWTGPPQSKAEDEGDRAGREIDCCGSSVSHRRAARNPPGCFAAFPWSLSHFDFVRA